MNQEYSTAVPDAFDRLLGSLHGLPDVTSTKPSTIRTVTPVVGTTVMFVVQTYRMRDQGDTVFLECYGNNQSVRVALPPQVADAIARQRDALTGKVRSKIGKATAAARKARGEVPGFMKHKKGKG